MAMISCIIFGINFLIIFLLYKIFIRKSVILGESIDKYLINRFSSNKSEFNKLNKDPLSQDLCGFNNNSFFFFFTFFSLFFLFFLSIDF